MKKRSTVLAFRLSNAQRTVLAYFALLFSILCVIAACATTTYSYLQHVLLDDISLLVRGYSASDVLLTISIVGTVLGTLFAIGCYICFRVSGLRDRKRWNSWLFAYIVTLIVIVIALCYLVFQCYVGLQQRTVERSLQVCARCLLDFSILVLVMSSCADGYQTDANSTETGLLLHYYRVVSPTCLAFKPMTLRVICRVIQWIKLLAHKNIYCINLTLC